MSMTALLIAAAAPAATGATAMDRAVRVAVREMQAADRHVRCTTGPQGTACVLTEPGDPKHGTAIHIAVEPARRPVAAGSIHLEDSLFGPGGGSSRYRGQTADHRFDIAVTRSERRLRDGVPALPDPPRLIRRIAALYARRR